MSLTPTLPTNNATYSSAEYWEQRFKTEPEYEWFKGYEAFRKLVEREVPRTARILVLGCGNSLMSEDMHLLSGYTHIQSTDLSAVVVERMQRRAQEKQLPPSLAWSVADMTALPFEDGTFDAVVEKGSLDCFLTVVRDPWRVEEPVAALIQSVLRESHRVLKPDGCLISITFSAPHFRAPLLRGGGAFTWRVKHETFGEEWPYFFYTCRCGLKALDEVEAEEATATVRASWLRHRGARAGCRLAATFCNVLTAPHSPSSSR